MNVTRRNSIISCSILLALAVFHAQPLRAEPTALRALMQSHAGSTGVYVLDRGEESLLARAWLTDRAERSIEVQYFIWSTDNVGTLASEALLRAAERGVQVRVIVDDLLVDAPDETLLALAAHPNIHIRIYNPVHSVGVSLWRRALNTLGDFRNMNQRMHNKIAVFDGLAGITGGRNMADEYYDYDHEYNFRDRDVLLLGHAVGDMQVAFRRYWNSPLSVPVQRLLAGHAALPDAARREQIYAGLHAYAADPANFAPAVRDALAGISGAMQAITQAIVWDRVRFISDLPGKNAGDQGLGGGGQATSALLQALRQARHSVVIQTPYLILPPGGLALMQSLRRRGVRIRIITNSLPSTDNLLAYSGYSRQKQELLRAGLELYEFKPHPRIAQRLSQTSAGRRGRPPIFAIHAKSMVIDGETLFVGTFNLDPRSTNLNTEDGAIIHNRELALQVQQAIERDMRPENSWPAADYDADAEASWNKRLRVWLYRLLPLAPVL